MLAASAFGWAMLWCVSWYRNAKTVVDVSSDEPSYVRGAFMVTKFAQAILASADVLLVSMLGGLHEAALYAVARRVTLIAGLGLNGVAMLYAPRLSAAATEPELLRRLTRRATAVSVWITVPIVAGLAAFGSWILSTFGQDYREAWPILVALLLGSAVNALAGPIGTVVNVNGQERFGAKVMVWAAASYVALAVPVVYVWGALGGAIIWSMVTLGWNAVLWRGIRFESRQV
jgi:O-antigen/teichoic acid export membrane protein